MFESLLIADGEKDELRQKWRERVGKGVTQTHLERWFGVDSIPDEYYGLNGWLGRIPAGRIVARRFITGRHTTFTVHGVDADDNGTVDGGSDVEACFWYLYAFKGESFLHCRWIPEHHFMQFDDSTGRITHFSRKRTADEVELDVSFIAQPHSHQAQVSTVTAEEEKQSHSAELGRSSVDIESTQAQHAHEERLPDNESSQPAATSIHHTEQPSVPQPAPQPQDSADMESSPSLTQSEKDREAADLAAFLSKEDERKRARMQDIAAEREDIKRRRRLAPLFDVDWLAVDRVVDHRRKRKERKKRNGPTAERTRKERVEEQIQEYQKTMHASAIRFIRAMQQQNLVTHHEMDEERSDMDVTTDVEKEMKRTEPEAMQDEDEAADEDGEDAVLVASRRVEYEFLVKWKKLSYDQCTWETFSFLSAAHIDGPQLATPLALSTSLSSPSSYLAAVRAYLQFVSRASVQSGSWIIPQSRQLRAAETRKEKAKLRNVMIEERRRKAMERRKARQAPGSNGASMSGEHKQHDDDVLKKANEDELSMSHSSDSDDDDKYSPHHSSSPSLPSPAKSTLSALSSRPPVTSSMRFGPSNLTLRPYQVDGVNWIVLNWLTGRNCILADEMGLGKHTVLAMHGTKFSCFSADMACEILCCVCSLQARQLRP